jgi:hypothetical protein
MQQLGIGRGEGSPPEFHVSRICCRQHLATREALGYPGCCYPQPKGKHKLLLLTIKEETQAVATHNPKGNSVKLLPTGQTPTQHRQREPEIKRIEANLKVVVGGGALDLAERTLEFTRESGREDKGRLRALEPAGPEGGDVVRRGGEGIQVGW